MLLEEQIATIQAFTGDWGRKAPSGYLRLLVNTGGLEFVKLTGILTARAQIAIVNGSGSISPTPDNIGVAGAGILRVENPGNGHRVVPQTSEAYLDSIVGPHWRSVTSGSIKNYLTGIPPEDDTKAGSDYLQTYPAVASGTLDVFYVKRPRKLVSDGDESDIPEEYHVALVWYAVIMLLTASGDQAMAGQLAFAQSRWDADVERAKALAKPFVVMAG